VSRYQKSLTSLDFTEARDIEWQWICSIISSKALKALHKYINICAWRWNGFGDMVNIRVIGDYGVKELSVITWHCLR